MKNPKSRAARLAVSAGLVAGIALTTTPTMALAEEPAAVTDTAATANDDSTSTFTATVDGTSYDMLEEAVKNASDGSVIELSGSYAGNAADPIDVTKPLTFKGTVTSGVYGASLNDVVFRVNNGAAITLDSLEVTGKSKIQDENASEIAVKNSHVAVNILTASANAPQNAFIWGTNEANGTHVVKFTLDGNVFEQASDDGYGFIFDWAVWADGSSVSNNTFGSAEKKIGTWLFRAMNFAKGAKVIISNNTGYLKDGRGAFSLVQNTTAANAATVVFSGNTITHIGTYKHFMWFDDANKNAASLKMVVEASNTYNGGAVAASDVYASGKGYGYLVTNATLDENGKLLSGDVKLDNATAADLKADLADGVEFDPDKGEVAVNEVATVDGKSYPSVAAAIEAAQAGQTVTLAKDVAESVVIPAGKEVTLDLAGHKLTNENSKHTITNNGMLIIKDSSKDKMGTVDNVSNGRGALYNGVAGVLTVDGGSFTRSAEASQNENGGNGNSWYVVKNFGTMTINDGTFKFSDTNQGYFSSLVANGWANEKDSGNKDDYGKTVATLTINGGTLTGGKIVVKNDDYSKLSMTGGSLVQPFKDYYALVNYHVAEISGGSITSEGHAVTNQILGYESDKGQLTISGGTITSNTKNAVVTVRQDNKVTNGLTTITGGTFKAGAEAIDTRAGCATVVKGGDFDSGEGHNLSTGSGTATVSGGTFNVAVRDSELSEDLVNFVRSSDKRFVVTPESDAESRAYGKVTVKDDSGNDVVTYYESYNDAKDAADAVGDKATVEQIPHYVAPTSYAVSVGSSDRGTAKLSSTSASAGTKVTVTLAPGEGFRAAGVAVTDASGKAVDVTAGANSGEYTFTMPASKVTVTPLFAKSYSDVDYSAWYATSVDFVSARGIMNGVGGTDRFGVGETLTRAELASLLWNYAEPNHDYDAQAKNATGMADVADGQWYTAAANWAVANGVVNGYDNPDGTRTFGPSDPVTLEQFCAVVRNLTKGTGSADLSKFLDSSEVSGWAKDSVSWAVSAGLVNGSDEADGLYLRAGSSMPRERVAAVVANAFKVGVLG